MAQSTMANQGFGLGALGKADDLRRRLLFTVGALIIYRLGTFIPLPGIDPVALADVFSQQSTGILGAGSDCAFTVSQLPRRPACDQSCKLPSDDW
jgi:preprotein translocase subunit SecY